MTMAKRDECISAKGKRCFIKFETCFSMDKKKKKRTQTGGCLLKNEKKKLNGRILFFYFCQKNIIRFRIMEKLNRVT